MMTALKNGLGAAAMALALWNPAAAVADEAKAIFAGGCFWCVESDFDHVSGVLETVSGYTGGELEMPTYENHEGHREAVEITYDPERVSYGELLDVFWRSVDPTDAGGQFCDRGYAYTTAIYAVTEEQLEQAKASKAAIEHSGKLDEPVVTPVETAGTFWKAEDYHQDYYKKNPARYKFYRWSCGRDNRVAELWGNEAHAGIKDH